MNVVHCNLWYAGLEAGSPDMYDLFDPHSSSGSEVRSGSILMSCVLCACILVYYCLVL